MRPAGMRPRERPAGLGLPPGLRARRGALARSRRPARCQAEALMARLPAPVRVTTCLLFEREEYDPEQGTWRELAPGDPGRANR
jgi:hypothetical protein